MFKPASDAFSTFEQEIEADRALRHDLHRHPETAFEEHRTAARVAERLRAYGLEVHEGIAGTGVVGVLKAGTSGRSIALRADMDALDMEEENDLPHRSTHAGKMHGCGHDGHTTMLLAAARELSRNPDFDGEVVFIFQPAEENEGGGRKMIEDGLFDRFPVEAVFGMHNIPGIPLGRFAVWPGAMMAGFDVFDIEITGRGAHAAMPQQGTDPLTAAAALVGGLQTIVSRNIDPMRSAVVSVTQFHAGSTYNVIPEQARLAGTVRYFDPEVRQTIETRMRDLVEHYARAHGVTARLDYQPRYPATLNSPAEAERSARVLERVFGAEAVDTRPAPMMAAEDFAFMLQQRPGAYVWAGNGADSPNVHNPKYDFCDDLIPYGATYWVELVRDYLPKGPA
jgi:amidohydrolase